VHRGLVNGGLPCEVVKMARGDADLHGGEGKLARHSTSTARCQP
jgi:hypothetical protein